MSTLRRRWSRLSWTLGLAVALVVGCGDDDGMGPNGNGNGNGDGADLAGIATAIEGDSELFFTNNPAVISLNGLAGLMINAGLAIVPAFDVVELVPAALSPEADAARFQAVATGLWRSLDGHRDRLTGPRAAPAVRALSIPTNLLGQTLVLNPATGEYEVDEERTGAPANGVRFILYEVDPATEEPVEPLEEIGFVDLVDTSTESTIQLSLSATVDGDQLIDFSLEVQATETSATLDASGFFSSDGSNRLNFSLDASATGTEEDATITANLELSSSVSGVTVNVEADASGSLADETGSASLEATITRSGDTIVFSADVDAAGAITGEVRVNGTLVANFSGSVDSETIDFTNAPGSDLTQQELAAFDRMLDASVDALLNLAGMGLLLLALSGV